MTGLHAFELTIPPNATDHSIGPPSAGVTVSVESALRNPGPREHG